MRFRSSGSKRFMLDFSAMGVEEMSQEDNLNDGSINRHSEPEMFRSPFSCTPPRTEKSFEDEPCVVNETT